MMGRSLEEQRMVIAKNLTTILEAKGENRESLRSHFGVGKSTVANWCTGVKKPKTETLREIAEFLNVPIQFLMGIDVFQHWDRINVDREGVMNAAIKLYGEDFVSDVCYQLYSFDPEKPKSANILDFIYFLYDCFSVVAPTEAGWKLVGKIKPTPVSESGSIGPNKRALLEAIKDCDESTASIILNVIQSVKQLGDVTPQPPASP